jgi:apolipoprotein N-acyltransferase
VLDFVVLALGSLLPAAAFPNELITDGWGFLGPVILVPVFWFTARRNVASATLGGGLWILLLTLASQSWLLAFHPLAFPLVLLFQVPWYALAFGVSSFLWRRFPVSGLWFQALWWTGFEFLRAQGFFAYPYGALATAFWAYPLTWQSADLIGTSGITFLLAWASAWGAAALSGRVSVGRLKIDLAAGLGLWALELGYGLVKWNQAPTGPLWRPALVQQARDPWKGGEAAYEADLDRLEALSTQALSANPDAVIWSETAFVPSVDYHNRYHDNPESLRLVRRLEDFLRGARVPFVLGNEYKEKTSDGTVKHYNAVLTWDGGWRGRYEKNRLVPFTESFPYKDVLPWVYRWLLDADTHFWEPGRGRTLLTPGTVVIGTPVCFEDAFPDGARAFSLAGAKVLVNLTNDSWAPGVASRNQHLSLAVFRTVETRLPLVRSGNDGATAAVSSRGEVLDRLPVGEAGVLQARVSLGSGQPTVYTQWGDGVGWGSLVVLALVLAVPRRPQPVVDKGEQL